MRSAPPRVAERLLEGVLGGSPEARTILGDLAEDFSEVLRRRGRLAARLWYWREATALVASTVVA